ncbi:MAG: hypothetical protein LQ350_007187 [Teloschistes chrysophthalmus]|nr:MAG: hypothetical protein LQ350_007187 [Niorma chrysophthalma]
MTTMNWRTIVIDLLDPESSANFSTTTLSPAVSSVTAAEVQNLSSQIKQLLRGGDGEGALRGALENPPYGGDAAAKEVHLATVVEILQSIKQSEMSPILNRIYSSDGGIEALDVLMKYLYKGMAHSSRPSSASLNRSASPQTGFSQIQQRGGGEGGGQAMSVLLSWHEKLVEIAGPGSIAREQSDGISEGRRNRDVPATGHAAGILDVGWDDPPESDKLLRFSKRRILHADVNSRPQGPVRRRYVK